MTELEIDPDWLQWLVRGEEPRMLKRELYRQGYTYQISFYGITTNTETNFSKHKRIEVFLNDRPTKNIVNNINMAFSELPIVPPYSIWICDTKNNRIRMVKGWD